MDEETGVCVCGGRGSGQSHGDRTAGLLPSKTSTLSNPPTQPPVCPVGEEMSLKPLSTPGDPRAPFILLFCYMLAAIPLEGSPAKPNPCLRLQSESQSCLIVLSRTLAKSSPEEDQQRRWRMQEPSAGKIALSLTAPNTLQGQRG